MTFQKPG